MLFTKVKKKELILDYINKNLLKASSSRGKLNWSLSNNYKLILNKKDNRNFIFVTKDKQSKLSFYYTEHTLYYFENQLSIKQLKQLLK